MLHQVPPFGENQFTAGKFAGIQAAGHAKHHGIINDTGVTVICFKTDINPLNKCRTTDFKNIKL